MYVSVCGFLCVYCTLDVFLGLWFHVHVRSEGLCVLRLHIIPRRILISPVYSSARKEQMYTAVVLSCLDIFQFSLHCAQQVDTYDSLPFRTHVPDDYASALCRTTR